jgi:pimeloyl-ACP methyl ester carboxylesterase
MSSFYELTDMAKDVVGLMDVSQIRSAHVVGSSMGGAIAHELAINFPERVRSLVSIMSSTGNPDFPPMSPEATALLALPPPRTRDELIARFVKNLKILRVNSFPEDEAKDYVRAERNFSHGFIPAGLHGNSWPPSSRATVSRALRGSVTNLGDSRRHRSAGASRPRPRHRDFDSRRQATNGRRHGSCPSGPMQR